MGRSVAALLRIAGVAAVDIFLQRDCEGRKLSNGNGCHSVLIYFQILISNDFTFLGKLIHCYQFTCIILSCCQRNGHAAEVVGDLYGLFAFRIQTHGNVKYIQELLVGLGDLLLQILNRPGRYLIVLLDHELCVCLA